MIVSISFDKAIQEIGYPDSKQADIRRKLVADLNDLEQEADIRTTSEVGQAILKYAKKIYPEQIPIVAAIINDYIKQLLSNK